MAPIGYIGWAASPSRVTRPAPQDGSEPQDGRGSRSTIGYSRIRGAPVISAGTSSQPNSQSANHGSTSSEPPLPVPVGARQRRPPRQLDLGHPVEQGPAPPLGLPRDGVGDELQRRVGARDRDRPAGQERSALHHPAPHHDAAPARRRLARVQLGADPRVQPVRADQHVAAQLPRRSRSTCRAPGRRPRPGIRRTRRTRSRCAPRRARAGPAPRRAGSSAARPGESSTAASGSRCSGRWRNPRSGCRAGRSAPSPRWGCRSPRARRRGRARSARAPRAASG